MPYIHLTKVRLHINKLYHIVIFTDFFMKFL